MRHLARGKEALERVAALVANLSPDKPWSITIAEYHARRTLEQNDRFHKIIAIIASETGNDTRALKAWAKDEWGPKMEVRIGDEVRLVPKSSADFTVAEMSEVMDRFEAWAATEWGVTA